jgi:hypothetical protein
VTLYPAPFDQRMQADMAALFARVAVLEKQAAQAAGAYSAFPCTSATRPVNPNVGQEVLESDTGNTSIWTGTAWETMVHEGVWTTYAPTWTTSATAPAIGNGQLLGSYCKAGRACHVRIDIVGGSTTTWGTGGSYRLGLPLTAATSAGAEWTGSWHGLRSGVAHRAGTAYVLSGGVALGAFVDNTGSDIGPTLPNTWATTDTMAFGLTYETAS